MKDRINKASGKEQLENLEHHLDFEYDAGFLTVSEFGRLDVLIMERIAEIEL